MPGIDGLPLGMLMPVIGELPEWDMLMSGVEPPGELLDLLEVLLQAASRLRPAAAAVAGIRIRVRIGGMSLRERQIAGWMGCAERRSGRVAPVDRRRPDHVRLMHNLVNNRPGGGARCDGSGPTSPAPTASPASSGQPTSTGWPGAGECVCPRKIATQGMWPHIDTSALLKEGGIMSVGAAPGACAAAIGDTPVIGSAVIAVPAG
jgi:hypothetical protein